MMHSSKKQIATEDGHARSFLRILWNFEIFHDRLGSALSDDISALII